MRRLLVLLALALAASLGSSVFSAIRGTESASLASYRWACHGTAAAMLALAAPLLGAFGSFGALIVAVTLTERAFARVENP